MFYTFPFLIYVFVFGCYINKAFIIIYNCII